MLATGLTSKKSVEESKGFTFVQLCLVKLSASHLTQVKCSTYECVLKEKNEL